MAYVLLALVIVGVWLFCLFDVITTDEGEVRHLPKFGWFLVTLLGFLPGAVLWMAFGRPRPVDGDRENVLWPPAAPGGASSPPPRGPDDDPDFLRDLDRRLRGDEDK
ncbi:PLDc N-terminal domain-containing protein [Actinomadura flavalba]|uniref:PLDc N-terminal domain-containing protein n=1 Tax=Actinomadura flavalba TaxID=1120938 RepID=UPI00036DBDA0|nr:PLDc N-terminal domain-containing protein [Actinomadura flavalba]